MTTVSHKFEDGDLQRRLISGLRELIPSPAYTIESDGTVTCDEDVWQEVNAVIHAIRTSCFRWYFRWSEDPDWSATFLEAMKRSGTPFQIEHHNRRIVFLLPREHEQLHEALALQAMSEIDPFRKPDASRGPPPRMKLTSKSPLITFDRREIPAYAQFVSSDQLTIGETYFHVSYVDRDMTIPTVSSLVYIGKNLDDDEVSTLYFQDVESYVVGLRITEENPDPDSMRFESWREDGFAGVYEFEYALEDLMRCSLRRKKG